MREATLGGVSALHDVRPRKPTDKSAAQGRTGNRSGAGGWARFRRARSRAALVVGSAGFTAIMIGIVLNATVMQKGHHPAPLFAGAAAPAPKPLVAPSVEASAPMAPAAPPAVDAIGAAITEPQPAPVAPPPAVHHAIHAAAEPHAGSHAVLARHAEHPSKTVTAAHRSKPVDGIAGLLAAAPHAAAPARPHVASAPAHPDATPAGSPMSLHPKAPVIAAKSRPAVPVAARDREKATAVN